jgi:hypothetical protein
VQPKGVPSSSLRAYFLPIEADESSTRLAMPSLRIFRAVKRSTMGSVRATQKSAPARGLTDIVDERAESRVLADGDDEALDRGNEGGEGKDLMRISTVQVGLACHVTHTTGLVLLTSPVAVLEQRVKDTADTERWLDDVGNELAH